MRFFSLVLTLVFLFAVFSSPIQVSAVSEDLPYFDILDLVYDVPFIGIAPGGTGTSSFILESFNVSRLELLVYIPDALSDFDVMVSGKSLTKSSLGNNLWILSGVGFNSISDFSLVISNDSSLWFYMTIFYYRVFSRSYNPVSISGKGVLSSSLWMDDFIEKTVSSGEITNFQLPFLTQDYPDTPNQFQFTLDFPASELQGVDFVTCNLGIANVSTFGGVIAQMGNLVLPVEISPWSNNTYAQDFNVVSFQIDLRSVTDKDNLSILITGVGSQFKDYPGPSLNIYNIEGLRDSGIQDVEIVWYRRLFNYLKSVLDSIKNLLTSSLASIQDFLQQILTKLSDFADLMINGDQQAAEEFQQQASQAQENLGALGDSLNAVDRPGVDDIDISIDSYVSPEGVSMLTSPISVILNNKYIFSIFSLSFILTLVGYVFFGKR